MTAINSINVREPQLADQSAFLAAMQRSEALHHPWVQAPRIEQEYRDYLTRFQQPNQKSFLVCLASGDIAGVFNVSEIVRGLFQNAYLGFYAVADFTGKGYMSQGLKQVLKKVFVDLELHRLEANIQPENSQSIHLVKKNGFREEGFSPRYLKINGEWRDHARFAMTFEDWQGMRENP